MVGLEGEDAAVGVAVAHLPDERLDRDVDDLVGVREHELVRVVDQVLGEQHRAGRALGEPVDADDLALGREVPDQRVGAVLLDVAVLQQHDRPPDAAEVLEHEVDHRPALDVDQRLRVLVADLGEALALAGGGDDDVDPVGLADRAHDAVVVDVGRVVDRAEHRAGRRRRGLADVGVLDHDALVGPHAEPLERLEVDLRVGLAALDVLVREREVDELGQARAVEHHVDRAPDRVGADDDRVAAREQPQHLDLLAVRRENDSMICCVTSCFVLRDELPQLGVEALALGEDAQLLAGGDALVDREVLLPRDRVDIGVLERDVEGVVVPLVGIDEHPVHVEDHGLDHLVLLSRKINREVGADAGDAPRQHLVPARRDLLHGLAAVELGRDVEGALAGGGQRVDVLVAQPRPVHLVEPDVGHGRVVDVAGQVRLALGDAVRDAEAAALDRGHLVGADAEQLEVEQEEALGRARPLDHAQHAVERGEALDVERVQARGPGRAGTPRRRSPPTTARGRGRA